MTMGISGAVTVFEYQHLVAEPGFGDVAGIPPTVFAWLESECLRASGVGEAAWARPGLRHGRRTIQMTNSVGVIRAPSGFQIEVLPKIGKVANDGASSARALLLDMLSCLGEFRHIRKDRAQLQARRMPLFEVFVSQFLESVRAVLQKGLASGYNPFEENLGSLRGKLLFSENLKRNLVRPDRFFAAFDEFTQNRPENRLIHRALASVADQTRSPANQRLALELRFALAEVPSSADIEHDFSGIARQRGMDHYEEPLAWARLLLSGDSPITGIGSSAALTLLFPMEALFEAFVAKHLRRQLKGGHQLQTQRSSRYLVHHGGRRMFRMRPDLVVTKSMSNVLLADTKWKLIDEEAASRAKYMLSQSDFYQMYAYGHSYLDATGDVVLIYPATGQFKAPLAPFSFPDRPNLTLWVLPFSLETKRVLLPQTGDSSLDSMLRIFKSAANK
ncbi:McrC family protein [Rhizobium johnstonii]|uniref:McrC family protein n=1 Tax=Rhizobium TaxID=379 RepID=UPI0010320624|nr:McrC family protein [Rhizobium leguminosarum]TBH47555.1 2-keto-D-gluconate dehydrogenase [Rhizobium leguminosarum]